MRWVQIDDGEYMTKDGRFKASHIRKTMWLLKDMESGKEYQERTLGECREVSEELRNG